MDLFKYPAVGFHFAVVFEIFPQTPNDLRFQEVSGLTATVETEDVREGGENRFSHHLPKGISYGELELKRGIFVGSGLVKWCKDSIENFDFKPTNVLITLLNDMHIPIAGWYVINAYPTEWSVSSFNSTSNEVAVESIKLKYNHYQTIRI